MMRRSARLTSPFAADWPIASPSEKLWSPMPTATRNASSRPLVMTIGRWCARSSSTAAAPGPRLAARGRVASQRS